MLDKVKLKKELIDNSLFYIIKENGEEFLVTTHLSDIINKLKDQDKIIKEIIELIDDGIDFEVEEGRNLTLRGRRLEDTKYYLRKILEG